MYGNNSGNFYGNNENGYSGYTGGSNSGYQGYNPYGAPGGGNKNNKKRGKGWLVAVLIVLGVIVVSALSIGIYSYASGLNNPGKEQLPWSEEQASEEPQASEEASGETSGESIAKEGTSDEYALGATPASGVSEMSPQQVASEVIPSVVCIQNYQTVVYENRNYGFGGRNATLPQQQDEIQLYGEGSGIIITEDGFIATNAHVVSDADLLKVVLSDDEIYEATLVGIDKDTDLAVIKINATGLAPAKLGDSSELKVGQYVMAIGNPGGLEFSSSVTLGIVSATERPLALDGGGYTMNTIQTDAAINPGNSGGALVNLKGQVVGISSAKYVAEGYEGLGFAITIDEALPIIKDLMDYGKVRGRSMLGITGVMLDTVTADYYGLQEGFYVYSVSNNAAGTLSAGDVITKLNDVVVTGDSTVKDAIKGMTPGTTVTLEYYRSSDSKTYTTQLTLQPYSDAVE